MRKNMFTLALTGLIIIILVITVFPREETAGLPAEQEEPPLQAKEALAKLAEAEQNEETEALEQLAHREDAVGFAAILALAELEEENREEYLRRALALYDNNETRFKLADYLAEADEEEAIDAYLKLLPNSHALEALKGLGAEQALILDGLFAGGHWQKIIEVLSDQNGSLADQEKLYLARALVERGSFDKAEPILKELVQRHPEDDTLLWQYARTLEAMEQTEEAMALYRRLEGTGGQRLGRLYERVGEPKKAAAAYAKSPEPAARWRGAVLWDEMGYQEEALPLYLQLSEESGSYQDDALYRSYLLLKEAADPQSEELHEELSKHPVWMLRLGQNVQWPQLSQSAQGQSLVPERLEAYQAAGREELIEVELGIAWERGTAADKVAVGKWYLSQENYLQSSRWGMRALREEPDNRQGYELGYPRPFGDEIKQAAAEFALEPELLWAVMREESRFQPAVASHAGAVGLLQIMPATGEEIATNLGLEFDRQMLTEPEVNIRFGAYYLRAMLNRYDDDLDKALAAYNGGPGNVNRWQSSELGATRAGFPTAVTFFETRQYITKVTDSYLTYQWLYNN